MKNKTKIIFSWFLVGITMLIIFNFSDQSSQTSSETSEDVVVQFLDVFMEKEDITPPLVQKFQFPVRKVAHFSIYMLLGFCMINALEQSFKTKRALNIILSIGVCFLYAISDEIHQNFSAGRGPDFVDVIVDVCGSIIGTTLFLLFFIFYNKFTHKKSRNS